MVPYHATKIQNIPRVNPDIQVYLILCQIWLKFPICPFAPCRAPQLPCGAQFAALLSVVKLLILFAH